MSPRLASLALLSSFALLAAERDARACSPLPCSPAMTAPSSGSIPSSALALPYIEPSGQGAVASPTFRVFDPADAEVLVTAQSDPWWPSGKLLRPTTPLASGVGYDLVYSETCSFGGTTGEVKRPFDVGAAAALPTASGTLRASGRVVGPRNVPTSSGSCTAKIEAVTFDVRITPTPELLAYANIAGFKVSIDGVDAGNVYYGRGKVDADGIVVTTLHAACGARASFDSNGPALGVHSVGVKVHVAGATSDPPEVVASFNFSCTDPNVEVDGGVASDAGTTGTPDAAGFYHPGDGRQPAANEDSASGEGCSASGASGKPAGAFALLVAGLALVAARARRKPRP